MCTLTFRFGEHVYYFVVKRTVKLYLMIFFFYYSDNVYVIFVLLKKTKFTISKIINRLTVDEIYKCKKPCVLFFHSVNKLYTKYSGMNH